MIILTYNDVFDYFKNIKADDPPITRKLVKNGYISKDGYIELSEYLEIKNPTQWWHIISYSSANIAKGKGDSNCRWISCGELIVYMAEASHAVDTVTLENLVTEIINSNRIDNRRYWNNRIKDVCWDAIKATIDNHS